VLTVPKEALLKEENREKRQRERRAKKKALNMPKHLLKAWVICLPIWPLSIALTTVAYKPLALTGVLISIPGMLGELFFTSVPLSNSAKGIAMIVARKC
jgi:hypothetical protein